MPTQIIFSKANFNIMASENKTKFNTKFKSDMIMINSSSKPQSVKHISKHLFKVMLGNKLILKH